MMRKLAGIITAGMVVFMLAGAAYSEYTEEEWSRLKTGEIVISEKVNTRPDGSQELYFVAKAYIKAPREKVWAILRDYNRFYEFFPNVKSTKIVRREGEVYWVAYVTKVMWVEVNYTLRFEPVEEYSRIEMELDKTRKHDIKETNATWIFEDAPDGSGTIVTYSMYSDPGVPAPYAIAKRAANASLPKVLENVRKRVESGGTWKKTKIEE